MTLYRMTYMREDKPRGTTFAGKNAEWAHSFATAWCATIKATLLTVKEVRPLQPELELRP